MGRKTAGHRSVARFFFKNITSKCRLLVSFEGLINLIRGWRSQSDFFEKKNWSFFPWKNQKNRKSRFLKKIFFCQILGFSSTCQKTLRSPQKFFQTRKNVENDQENTIKTFLMLQNDYKWPKLAVAVNTWNNKNRKPH